MSYNPYHSPCPVCPDLPPILSSPNGTPLYDDGYSSLLGTIIATNDVTNLNIYVETHGSRFFGEHDIPDWDVFCIATRSGSTDALRALVDIYQADSKQTETLEERFERKRISLLGIACGYACFETAEYIMRAGPPLAKVNEIRVSDGPLVSAVSALQDSAEFEAHAGHKVSNSEIENFVFSLLDRGAPVHHADLSRASENDAYHLHETVLGSAAAMGSYKLASRLITEGADIHAQQSWQELFSGIVQNVTALHIASGSWNMDFIQALVETYRDGEFAKAVTVADSKGRVPLHWALHRLSRSFRRPSEEETICTGLRVVQLLLDANPDTINTQAQHGTAFNFAVTGNVHGAGRLALVKLLLSANPQPSAINARDESGATVLLNVLRSHESSTLSRTAYFAPLVDILLQHGADRTLHDNKGQTALHKLASSSSFNDPIDPVLLDKFITYVDINEPDINGWAALHFMARNLRQVDAARLLVARGADVHAVNKLGNTPLHEIMGGAKLQRRELEDGTLEWPAPAEKIAAHEEIVEVLRGSGADFDVLNTAGKTPRELLVERRGREEREGIRGRGRGGRGARLNSLFQSRGN